MAFGVSAGVFFGFGAVFFTFGLGTAFTTVLATFLAALACAVRFFLVAVAVAFWGFTAAVGFVF